MFKNRPASIWLSYVPYYKEPPPKTGPNSKHGECGGTEDKVISSLNSGLSDNN
jgi:hypothetical protein